MTRILALLALLFFAGQAEASSFPIKGSDGNTYTGYSTGPLATFVTGQVKIAAAAAAMPSNALTNGVVLSAKSTNTGPIFIGTSSAITTTYDGTGQGFALVPGQTVTVLVTNTNAIYTIGTANDVLTWEAN